MKIRKWESSDVLQICTMNNMEKKIFNVLHKFLVLSRFIFESSTQYPCNHQQPTILYYNNLNFHHTLINKFDGISTCFTIKLKFNGEEKFSYKF